MYRFFRGLFALIGLIVVVVAAGGGYLAYKAWDREEPVSDTIVLNLDLDQDLAEYVPADPLSEALFARTESLRDVVDALDRARMDPRVKGVVARLGGDQIGTGKAQEIRAAVERFRASDRFAFAFSHSFGELGPGDRSYYMASGFERIWLQPVGLVGLTGVSASVPFARGALDELNITPELRHREEYKSFMNTFTEKGFTEPHREMMEALIGDLEGQLVSGIAQGRGMDPAALRQLIDRGPFLDREAVAAKLVDQIGYFDEVRSAALARAGAGAELIDGADYLRSAGRPHVSGPTIAVIYGTGSIQSGKTGVDPLSGGTSMGSEDMVEAFDKAAADPQVRAILFRIDSGGGSAVASETIRRSLVKAREAGKPVIVSMGEAAASGGYWIAMNADRIVAQPGTLTGSIGVVAGKMVTSGLWDRFGIEWGEISKGAHASMWSSLTPYSDTESQRLDAILDDIYGAFVRNVAEARRLPVTSVRDIAKGRVWTGAQAKALGLVDELGDMDTALGFARQAAGLAQDAAVTVEIFPKPDSPFRQVVDLVTGASEARTAAATQAMLARFQPLLRELAPLVRDPAAETLTMPPTGLTR
ncbi:protease IV [Skermanella stibiiresistens SB22]|uniref:Protease IV n=2 Tax=Skermanella TaxID=204447 RepID=W9H0T0_9PROT|nr:protease IV [Skermanella stibiiresistens SB22]